MPKVPLTSNEKYCSLSLISYSLLKVPLYVNGYPNVYFILSVVPNIFIDSAITGLPNFDYFVIAT